MYFTALEAMASSPWKSTGNTTSPPSVGLPLFVFGCMRYLSATTKAASPKPKSSGASSSTPHEVNSPSPPTVQLNVTWPLTRLALALGGIALE